MDNMHLTFLLYSLLCMLSQHFYLFVSSTKKTCRSTTVYAMFDCFVKNTLFVADRQIYNLVVDNQDRNLADFNHVGDPFAMVMDQNFPCSLFFIVMESLESLDVS